MSCLPVFKKVYVIVQLDILCFSCRHPFLFIWFIYHLFICLFLINLDVELVKLGDGGGVL